MSLPTRRRRRAIALLSCLLLLAALLGAGYHQASSVHGYCTDHGARIHLDHDASDPRSTAARDAAHRALTAPIHTQGSHDCLFLDFLAQSMGTPQSVALPTHIAPTPRRRAPRQVLVAAAVKLLRLAPKCSPPA